MIEVSLALLETTLHKGEKNIYSAMLKFQAFRI